MVGTNFRGAELVKTNLSSSNAKNAIFREANLACADLRSSTLGGADFRAAILSGATLKLSGGCNTATFNAATTFCGTTMCDGTVRNDDCPGGVDRDVLCCTQGCGANQHCAPTGGCACDTGFSSCQTPSGLTCSAGACCLDSRGTCCASGTLDRRGRCCLSGILDRLGDCCCPGSTPGQIECSTGYSPDDRES